MKHYHILGIFEMQNKVKSTLLIGEELAVLDIDNCMKIFNKNTKKCT